MKKKLIIFGNGEIADIAFFYFKNENKYKIEAFCMDKEFIQDTKFNNLPVIPFDGIEKKYTPKEYYFHLALSYQKLNMNLDFKTYFSNTLLIHRLLSLMLKFYHRPHIHLEQ